MKKMSYHPNLFSLSKCLKLCLLIAVTFFFADNTIGQNLLTNGDFESTGGYSSNYILYTGGTRATSNQRDYAIMTDPYGFNTTSFVHCTDNSGAGKMMVVDGASYNGEKIWIVNSGNISLISGRKYEFSYYIRSISSDNNVSNSAVIKLNTNGTTSTPVLTAGSETCPIGAPSAWTKVTYTFTATTTSVQIWLTDATTSAAGNDFAFDDFSLTLIPDPLVVSYAVINPTCPSSTDGFIIVYGSGGVAPYSYSLNGGAFSSNNIFSGLGASSNNYVTIQDSNTPTAGTVSTLPAINVTAPANALVIRPDTAICSGSSVGLSVSGGGAGYTWSASPSDPTLTNPALQNPTVSPTVTTTYTVTSSLTTSQNLVFNSDFEKGNIGFNSDYSYHDVLPTRDRGSYGITKDPVLYDDLFTSSVDHSGTGYMMVIDGSESNAGNNKVWSQTIPVNINTNYTFSYWIQTVATPQPAIIETQINGTSITGSSVNPFTASAATDGWQQVIYSWNSGSNTTATIVLFDRNTAGVGNDFALDDLSFMTTSTCSLSKSVTITVNNITQPVVTPTQPTCTLATGSVTITDVPGETYSFDGGAYTSTLVYSGLAAGSSHTVFAKNAAGCISQVINITLDAQPATPVAPTVTPTQPTCTVATGTITITGVTGETYSFDAGAYTATLVYSGLAAGSSHTVYAKNTAGCISPVTNITLDNQLNSPAAPTVIPTQATCTLATGTVTITGVTGETYSFDAGTYSATLVYSGLAAGSSHTVYAKNTAGCISAVTNITLDAQPATPVAPTVTPTQPTCTVATGSVTITGVTGETYSFDAGAYSATLVYSGLAAGSSHTIFAKNTAGCISAVTNITLNAQPATPVAPTVTPTQPTCTVATGSVTITGVTGETYSFDAGAYSATLVYSGLAAGSSHTVYAKNVAGCISPVTNITLDNQLNSPAAPTVTPTQPTCTLATGTLTITGVTGETYSFDAGAYSATLVYSGLTAGSSHTVYAKNTAGCISAVSTISLNAQPATPVAPAVTPTQPTCTVATGTVTITGVTGETYSFDAGAYSATLVYSGLAAGSSHTIYAKNTAGCISSVTNITLGNQPAGLNAPSVTSPVNYCQNATAVALTATGSGLLWYTQQSGGNGSGTAPVPSTTSTGSTSYYVSQSNETCGESGRSKIDVIVTANPVVSAGNDAEINAGSSTTLTGTSNVTGTYLWDPAITVSNAGNLITSATPTNTTTYTLTVTAQSGCKSSDQVVITVKPLSPCGTLRPPNAFTPNNDGFYDKWNIGNLDCVLKMKVDVYNRWGGLVYHADDYKNDWDGTYKSKPLPDGTYYYVITVFYRDTHQGFYKGNVTIIR